MFSRHCFRRFMYLIPRAVYCVFLAVQIVLLLRLVPFLPFNMLNYLLSVTPVGIGEYMMASWLGMMVCSPLIHYTLFKMVLWVLMKPVLATHVNFLGIVYSCS